MEIGFGEEISSYVLGIMVSKLRYVIDLTTINKNNLR